LSFHSYDCLTFESKRNRKQWPFTLGNAKYKILEAGLKLIF